MTNSCLNSEPFTPEKPWTPCDYVRPAIKTIKAKRDEHGNWFVMINDDDKWIGATLNEDKDGLYFSY